jgi:hypothetical protein
VSYSIVLICLEFIYGLQLTKNEMPDYEEIGLVRHNVPFFDLLKKVIKLKNYTVKLSNLMCTSIREVRRIRPNEIEFL